MKDEFISKIGLWGQRHYIYIKNTQPHGDQRFLDACDVKKYRNQGCKSNLYTYFFRRSSKRHRTVPCLTQKSVLI